MKCLTPLQVAQASRPARLQCCVLFKSSSCRHPAATDSWTPGHCRTAQLVALQLVCSLKLAADSGGMLLCGWQHCPGQFSVLPGSFSYRLLLIVTIDSPVGRTLSHTCTLQACLLSRSCRNQAAPLPVHPACPLVRPATQAMAAWSLHPWRPR